MSELTSNDWAVIYRLVNNYVEACYANPELPPGDPSHEYREKLLEKVTQERIKAKSLRMAASP